MNTNILKKIILLIASPLLISVTMADSLSVKPFIQSPSLTRDLAVTCNGGTTVSFPGTYFQGDDGSWNTNSVNGAATSASINTLVTASLIQTLNSIPLLANDDGSQYLYDSIPNGQVLKAQAKDQDGSIVADIQITLFPNTCGPFDDYATAFAASCKGFVMVGSKKVTIDADTTQAQGSTNWVYSVPQSGGGFPTISRDSSTARTLSGVLAKTKNLTDFGHLGADQCAAPDSK